MTTPQQQILATLTVTTAENLVTLWTTRWPVHLATADAFDEGGLRPLAGRDSSP